MMQRIRMRVGVTTLLVALAAPSLALDYEVFKTKVEPIFLTKRGEHARCYDCHSSSNNAFHLERLSAGEKFWNEEQSRKNFALMAGVIDAAKPADSALLMHPLAPEAGGDAFHSGGRQFDTRDDPDWKTLNAFVTGK